MITYSQITVSSTVELTSEWEADLVRCLTVSGPGEVTLPPAQEVLGRRYTIKGVGANSVYVNPADGYNELIEGGGTYTLPAGGSVTFQAVETGTNTYAWEKI